MAHVHASFFRSPLPLKPVALAAALTVASLSVVHGQELLAQAGGTPLLKEVVISSTRSEQNPDDLPMRIDVINAQALEEGQVRDLRDVARDQPNITVPRSPARFTLASGSTGRDQNAGFNIRGLEGNRVLMLVDGIRLPRSYVFSANAFGRDYVDVGLLQRIEVLRGATSALYGSDGMGGLVNFITADPSAFLKEGKILGGRVSAAYDGDDDGKRLGATLAGRTNDTVQWLISANVGRANELENMGDTSTLADPSVVDSLIERRLNR